MIGKKHSPLLETQDQSRWYTRLYYTRLYSCRRRTYTTISVAILLLGLYRYAFTMCANDTRAAPDMGLSKYRDSIFLPYVKGFSSDEIPMVQTNVEGVEIEMPVDTGSTGLLIGAPLLKHIDSKEGTPTYHYLTSSTILYVGRLVDLTITFYGQSGDRATARAPVLVVDEKYKCPWYDPKRDADRCKPGPRGEIAERLDTSKIMYMGVGFGRNGIGSGQPNATPERNPFLNVVSINGAAVSPDSLRTGYTISTRGVHVGLTSENTRGFVYAQLEHGVTYEKDPRDWAMVRANLSIDGEGGSWGYGLVDTGIRQMYIRAEDGVVIPTISIPNPDPKGIAAFVDRVKPGTRIGIDFLTSHARPPVGYRFVVGEKASPVEPYFVKKGKKTPPPFVNTGRNLLYGYDIAFDAAGGRFGFRAVDGCDGAGCWTGSLVHCELA